MYYNTNNLTGDQLREANAITSKQDQAVLTIFMQEPQRLFNTHEIEEIAKLWPRTSIIRSVNTLMNKGLIVMTNNMVIGKYGKPVHTFRLVRKDEEQLSLF